MEASLILCFAVGGGGQGSRLEGRNGHSRQLPHGLWVAHLSPLGFSVPLCKTRALDCSRESETWWATGERIGGGPEALWVSFPPPHRGVLRLPELPAWRPCDELPLLWAGFLTSPGRSHDSCPVHFTCLLSCGTRSSFLEASRCLSPGSWHLRPSSTGPQLFSCKMSTLFYPNPFSLQARKHHLLQEAS